MFDFLEQGSDYVSSSNLTNTSYLKWEAEWHRKGIVEKDIFKRTHFKPQSTLAMYSATILNFVTFKDVCKHHL